ncbi:MAG: hypothetical protein JWN70_1971 [Planctomycetaceae bacterium]|nr:hypothetical protein [Planctomycetaceae bacterium]
MQDGSLNEYFYLSVIVPVVLMVVAGLIYDQKIFMVAVVGSLIATYQLGNLAVQKKWEIRNRTAVTEIEKVRATADGANLVFTAILIAPVQAVVLTFFGSWVGLILGSRLHPENDWPGLQNKRKQKTVG